MMFKFKIVLAFILITTYSYSQISTVCAVKYKDYSTNLGTYNYYLTKERVIGINEQNYKAQFVNGFPLVKNGIVTTETDTIKYKKEYEEFIKDLINQMSKYPVDVKCKYYDSDILKTSISMPDIKKNFIVLDSLAKMNNWQITNDTVKFMGFICQKAYINYQSEKYTAFFAPQLPFNAGPLDFRGLPGLILKVFNNTSSKGYEAIEILTPYKGNIPSFNAIGEYISRKDWVSFINDFNRKAREARRNQLEQERKKTENENQ